VFTAGIGENSGSMRARIAKKLSWLGVMLDPASNAAGETLISRPGTGVGLYVIPTDEELMIARHTLGLLSRGATQQGGLHRKDPRADSDGIGSRETAFNPDRTRPRVRDIARAVDLDRA